MNELDKSRPADPVLVVHAVLSRLALGELMVTPEQLEQLEFPHLDAKVLKVVSDGELILFSFSFRVIPEWDVELAAKTVAILYSGCLRKALFGEDQPTQPETFFTPTFAKAYWQGTQDWSWIKFCDSGQSASTEKVMN